MSGKHDLSSCVAQQSSGPGLQVWEEVKFEPEVMCEPCEPGLTLAMAQLEDGDILCFQKALTEVGELCRAGALKMAVPVAPIKNAGPVHTSG